MKPFLAIDTLVLLFAAGALGKQQHITPSASASSASSSSSSNSPFPQSSPVWLSNVQPMPGNVKAYPSDVSKIPTGPLSKDIKSQALKGYPPPSKLPPTNSPEVQAVIKAIDWSKVPNTPPRKTRSDGYVITQGYDESDSDCWWSVSRCVKPKYPGLPEDVVYCPKVGDWGLTFDDGPATPEERETGVEPELYNFLAKHQQKADLFYIGSNVFNAPAAAQRALADGHTLCSHTWSHPVMTAQSNEVVVAELYWSLRVIKETTGVTTRCWRPPYGDVDDRVRAIAWQMGLRTILFDDANFDWDLPGGPGSGKLPTSFVDGLFEKWIQSLNNGTDQHGHIILESILRILHQHEHSAAAVSMTKKWLPKIKEEFRVMSFTKCMNISNPYWEEGFVYPTDDENPATLLITLDGILPTTTTSLSILMSSVVMASIIYYVM